MKKLITTFALSVLLAGALFSQNNNLIIYSQDGLKFTVILNGIRQNIQPETNVKVTGLNAPNYQVKIIFESGITDLDKNIYMMWEGVQSKNSEFSFAITKTKNAYKLRPVSHAPIENATATATPQQTTVAYSPVEPVTANTTTTIPSATVTGTTTTTDVVQTSVTAGTATNGTGASVDMNINDIGIGMNVNVTGMTPGVTSTTTTTTTTTSTTYSSATSSGTTSSGVAETNTNTPEQGTYVLPGYTGTYGCAYPMSSTDFESAKKSISSKSFDDSRLTVAKQIIGNNCLLSEQIKEIMGLMSFEATKLDLAKFAWHHNLDRGNYYKLNDAFTFESSIDELNEYTQSH